MFRKLLAHPSTRGLDLDSPHTTHLRKQIIRSKPFLKKIYKEWYQLHVREIDRTNQPGGILELGSGGGFLSELLPAAITSDIFMIEGLRLVLDGQSLPFKTKSLKAVLMTNVLHHIPEPRKFFKEAARCVQPKGVVVMIEPWLTPWSRFVYKNLHHEPLDDKVTEWRISRVGPLSSANSALPWVIFERDKEIFERDFKELHIRGVSPFMPFRYLLSGGVSLHSLMFSSSFPFWRWLEKILTPWMGRIAMFAKIVLVRTEEP